ncbi:MAG: Na(+)/H(+) antiporter NhaA, partial [Calditrichaeota bacterium]
LHGVPVGIAAGLFIGKQVGIFLFCWLTVKLKWAPLPSGINMTSLYGVSILAGVGFTMSLFIGSLAFEATGANLLFDERLGIIAGSIVSGLVGYLVLRFSLGTEEESLPTSKTAGN